MPHHTVLSAKQDVIIEMVQVQVHVPNSDFKFYSCHGGFLNYVQST